ncbi:hypothetical protein AAVH_14869 [Aphelenchoides avenae]|nr:hypothetical protein AAVH_14869 [Aphelenchus avenae]
MSDTTKVKTHYAGKLDHKCSGCDALFYRGEAKRGVDGSYGPCCSCGAVSSPSTYDDFPRSVYELLKWEHPLSADFHRHVRNYNSSLSLASISCNLDRRYTGPCGPYCFRIHGNVYTLFNNGTYAEGVPSYAQLYVVNSEQAMDYRMQHPANHGINRGLLQSLDEEIRAINPHAQSYQMLRAVEEAAAEYQRQQAEVLRANGMEVEEAETASYKLLFKLPGNVDRRLYNIPRANEIAAVFRTDADGSIPPAELIIHSGNGRTYRDRQGNVVFNPLHHAGKLFQEYVVIICVHVEGDRLEWVRANQDELRANDYRGLHVSVARIGMR